MGRLTGEVAIVTGAAQGIGAAYAKALAAEGAATVIVDILDGSTAAQDIAATGGIARAVRADVTDDAALAELVAATVAEFGRIDILVNNAAIFAALKPKPFEEISLAEWDKVMLVNIRGSFQCVTAVAPQMRRQRYGKIINISSGTVFKGVPSMLHYVTSKGAIIGFTRALARELGGDGICVNTLAPGLTESEGMLATGFWTNWGELTKKTRAFQRGETPEDLTGALVFLASHDSDFMTGQCMVVDGGSVTW